MNLRKNIRNMAFYGILFNKKAYCYAYTGDFRLAHIEIDRLLEYPLQDHDKAMYLDSKGVVFYVP